MARFKLEIVRPECIGCESCVQACPKLFSMADDGQSTLKNGTRVGDNDELEIDEEDCSREAAESCPVACIHLYENGSLLV